MLHVLYVFINLSSPNMHLNPRGAEVEKYPISPLFPRPWFSCKNPPYVSVYVIEVNISNKSERLHFSYISDEHGLQNSSVDSLQINSGSLFSCVRRTLAKKWSLFSIIFHGSPAFIVNRGTEINDRGKSCANHVGCEMSYINMHKELENVYILGYLTIACFLK